MVPSQLPEPDALVDTRLTRQMLVAALFGFGSGRGGPKRQPGFPGYSGLLMPAEVQSRLLPVSTAVVGAIVKAPLATSQLTTFARRAVMSGMTEGSGTPTPAPPK